MISRTLRTFLREKAPVGSRLSILREGEVLGGGEKYWVAEPSYWVGKKWSRRVGGRHLPKIVIPLIR